MEQIEQRLLDIETDVKYIRGLLEDLTLSMSSNQDAKKMVSDQMSLLKQMMSNVKLPPGVKDSFDKIFDTGNIL